jgi:hypothetical protein
MTCVLRDGAWGDGGGVTTSAGRRGRSSENSADLLDLFVRLSHCSADTTIPDSGASSVSEIYERLTKLGL